MSFIKKHKLLLIFLLGLIIRLFFIFGPYAFDVNNHIIWAKDLHERGFLDFFNKESSEIYGVTYPNYPPLALFIFYLFYPLPKIIFNFFWQLNVNLSFFPSVFISFLESIDKRLFIAAMLKLPAIFFDLGLAWILVLFTKKLAPNKKNLRFLIASLILFNPVFIYNSSLWGQIDVIPLFFVLVSIYLLLFTKRNILSGVFFVLSLLVKPTTLVFIPIYGIMFLKKYGLLKTIKTIIISNFIFWLFFKPFLIKVDLLAPYFIYWQKIISAQSLPYITNGAFNFWLIFMDIKKGILDTYPFIFNLSYRVWGYLLAGLFILIILFRLVKLKFKKDVFIFSLFFSSFVSILFLTKMHERYFLLPLPFLLLLILKNKKILNYFCLFSLLAFLNHYYSWGVFYLPFIFITISNIFVYKSLSLINILVFFCFFKKQRF